MLIVTLLPSVTVDGDTDGVVARGIVVPVKVPLRLADPNCVDDEIAAATASDNEPSALWVAVNDPLAIVLLLPAATPRTSQESPVYRLTPPIVTVTVEVPLLHDGLAIFIFIASVHEILPVFVALDVPDSLTVSTNVPHPELKFFENVAMCCPSYPK